MRLRSTCCTLSVMLQFNKLFLLVALGSSGVCASAGAILYGGLEDTPGSTGVENMGDYNDLVFKMTGDFTTLAQGAQLSPLTPSMINESGDIYWNQHSLDGSDYNLGYCVLGGGNCPYVGTPDATYSYLAGKDGSAPASILFNTEGPVTINYLLSVTSGANSLGWYDPSDPTVLHPLFSPSSGPGASITFMPSSVFALYSQNVLGQTFSSIAAANIGESATQQHFAFIDDPPGPSQAPEPATFYMMAAGLIIALFRIRPASWSR